MDACHSGCRKRSQSLYFPFASEELKRLSAGGLRRSRFLARSNPVLATTQDEPLPRSCCNTTSSKKRNPMGRLTILMKSNSESSKLTPRGPQLVLPHQAFSNRNEGRQRIGAPSSRSCWSIAKRANAKRLLFRSLENYRFLTP
jgi:hypothetical protein